MRSKLAFAVLSNKAIILGGGLGLLIAGFWGFCFGAGFGFLFDAWERYVSMARPMQKTVPQRTLAYADNLVIALTAYACALDLPQLKMPLQTLHILKNYFLFSQNTLRYIGKIIDHASDEKTELAAHMQTLKSLAGQDKDSIQKIMHCFVDLAKSPEGKIDNISLEALSVLAAQLHYAEEWKALATTLDKEGAQDDPHHILGVSPTESLQRIAMIYRDLMRENHPDRWVRVTNPYTRARLQNRAARINDAYERLTKKRA